MRGALIVEVARDRLEAARARLATVPRPSRLRRARIQLHDDGRASWELPTALFEIARVAQAVGVAACVSVATSLAWDWMFYRALPAGFAVGLGFAAVTIAVDRRRRRAEARRFVRAAISRA